MTMQSTLGGVNFRTAGRLIAVLVGAGLAIAGPQGSNTSEMNQKLLDAVRGGDNRAVKMLLAQGAEVNIRDAEGTPLLMNAVLYADAECVRLLLDHKADPNAQNGAGATALLWTAADPEKAQLLLSHGANVNVQSKLGRTPLLAAAGVDGAGLTTRLLLEKGADLNVKDVLQGPPGIPTGSGGAPPVVEAAKARDGQALRMLIAKGVDVNAHGNGGTTALSEAILQGHVDNVRMLLKAGASPNVAVGAEKYTALILASFRGDSKVVRMLLDSGADVNQLDAVGSTALMWASSAEKPDVTTIQMLLQAGADPAIKNRRNETALTWAAWNGGTPGLDSPVSRLLQSTKSSSLPTIREAVERGFPALQKSGPVFSKKSPCVSCHHQMLPAMATGIARDRGFAFDESVQNEELKAILGMVQPAQEVLREGSDVLPQITGTGPYVLMALAAQKYPADGTTAALVHNIALRQRPDGTFTGWAPRPPISGGDLRETVLCIRAMDLYAPAGRREEMDQRIARATGWLVKAKPATPEEAIMRLMGLAWGRARQSEIRAAAREVLAAQRADGGWAQLETRESDAYATGEALVALYQSGTLKASDAAYRKGVEYLLRTQNADGTWHVKTRAYPFQPLLESGFPHGRDQWISAAGTSYALMALMLGAEPVQPVSVASAR